MNNLRPSRRRPTRRPLLLKISLLPRWLLPTALLVLVLQVAMPITSAPAQAQAPTQPVIVTFGLDFGNARTSICVGETVSYRVRVIARVLVPGHPDAGLYRVTGVSLTQTFDGSILQDMTSVMTTPPIAALFADVALDVTYQLKGIAPGRTSIDYAGVVTISGQPLAVPSTYPVADSLHVRVVPCNLKVVTIARFTQRLIGGTVKGIVIIYDGHLRGDQEGYYVGEADVVYLINAAIPGCGYANTLKLGKVTMRGRLDNDEVIHVDLTFDTATGSEIIPCEVGTGGGDVFITPGPLKITVPNVGGSVTLQQPIRNPAGSANATVNAYITIESIQ
ncbi:MAG: hypothetical protein K8L91_03630 [Anaerolineae bacterium]|nr:hypothetical protein [Anaerolineae bacterium]